MRHKVLSGVGEQNMDTGGSQVSDLEDIEIHWEDLELNMDAVCQLSIDTPFCPSTFTNFERVPMAENSCLIEKEQDKQNSPPLLLTTALSEITTQTAVLMKNRPLGTRIENNFNYFY